MLFALVALVAVVVVGFLTVLDRRDARAVSEREREAQDRRLLLDRIERPGTVVTAPQGDVVDGLLFVPVDDDAAWQSNREETLNAP